MATLPKGPGTIRATVKILMQNPISQARKRAIFTISKKHGITPLEAQFRQAKAIGISQSRKP